MSKTSRPKSTTPDFSQREELESAVVRFAGDPGDGMQVTGGQISLSTTLAQNNLVIFPVFPEEIRAPAGSPLGIPLQKHLMGL